MIKSLCLLISFIMTFNLTAQEPIVIGSKAFSESLILSEMTAILLEEKYGQKVIRKHNLGGTSIAFDALKNGDIHLYPEYTGTGYIMILKMNGEREPDKVFNIVAQEFKRRWGIIWSHSLGFNNSYALAVRRSDPRFQYISKTSELTNIVASYTYAAPYEYMERKDGHAGFTKRYNLNFTADNVISMNAGLMYKAIKDKQVDMITVYSTDGRIKAYDLKLIEDDLNYFPPYYASLIINEKALLKYKALQKVVPLMESLITEEEMIDMNDQVDRLKLNAQEVARQFLIKKGLVRGQIKDLQASEQGFFAFLLKKRSYLLKLLKEHLLLSFGALFLALIISLPTGILLTRYPRSGKMIFPIINTIQTIPSLALLGFLIPLMGIGIAPAMLALFLYSLLPLVRNTYTGISSVDKKYIEASKGIGLTNMQILYKVEIPLALPVMMAGLRTASVIVIGTATIAALIGAGGFGDPIFRGVSTVNRNLILLGAIPAALLAVTIDKLLGISERLFVSKGIRLMNKR